VERCKSAKLDMGELTDRRVLGHSLFKDILRLLLKADKWEAIS
jgi:hypothetical protein